MTSQNKDSLKQQRNAESRVSGTLQSVLLYFRNPRKLVLRLLPLLPFSDESYLKMWYRISYGERLNLEEPKTYNEKLQWLKLFDRKPLYTTLVDKYAVKRYVTDKIGEKYVIPLIAVWNNPSEIDFESLPEQFVLKVTHGGGSYGVAVCKDKKTFDREKALRMLENAMKVDGYLKNREWPYKNVPRRVIAEKYMEDNETKELRDYKFFCFNGVPKLLFVATGRGVQKEPNFDWFDMSYNHIQLKTEHPNSDKNHLPQKPVAFEEMKEVAEKLSQGIPHVRIDLYEVNGKVYFGEYTFYHWSGINKFEPEEWNKKMGDWIQLPDTKNV